MVYRTNDRVDACFRTWNFVLFLWIKSNGLIKGHVNQCFEWPVPFLELVDVMLLNFFFPGCADILLDVFLPKSLSCFVCRLMHDLDCLII